MGVVDGLLILAILGGAGWLLCRSILQNGACSGCGRCGGGQKQGRGKDRLIRIS